MHKTREGVRVAIKPLFDWRRLGAAFLISATVLAGLPIPVAQAATQNHYLWRNDDGTAAASQDTTLSFSPGDSKRLRLNVDGTSSEEALLRTAKLGTGVSSTYLYSSAIDTSAGYAYFGTMTTPSEIIKVRLSDYTAVDRIVLNSGENYARTMVVDDSGSTHYLYAGTWTTPAKIVKINLDTFTRTDVITLTSGINRAVTSIIDTSAGYAYFTMNDDFTNQVVRIDLSTFAVSGTNMDFSDSTAAWASVIDTSGPTHYAYFGSYNDVPARITKVNLSTWTEDSHIHLASSAWLDGATIDTTNGYAYFTASYSDPARIVKINLSTFTETSATSLTGHTGEVTRSMKMDSAGSYIYVSFNRNPDPAKVIKYSTATSAEVSSITLSASDTSPYTSVIDSSYVYIGHSTDPARINRIALSSFSSATALSLDQSNGTIGTALVDAAAGYAYFNSTDSGKVLKVRLSDYTLLDTLDIGGTSWAAVIDTSGGTHYAYYAIYGAPGSVKKVNLSTFTVSSTLSLTNGTSILSAVIDPSGGYAYFGTGESPAKATRVKLSDFTEDGSVTFSTNENVAMAAGIDLTHGKAYFATNSTNSYLVEVTLSSFSRTGSYQFTSGEDDPYAMVVDPANQFAYVGNGTSPAKVVKVNLSTMARTDALTLGSGENWVYSAAVDLDNRYAYFLTNTSPAKVAQVDLTNFTEPGVLTLNTNENSGEAAAIDASAGYLYMGSGDTQGPIMKIQVSKPRTYRLEYGTKATTCGAISSWTQVGSSGGGEAWVMSPSANVTEGAATTNLAGLTNGNSLFFAGQERDTASQTGAIAMGRDDESTEVEFSVTPGSGAAGGTDYCFRLTDAGTATNMSFTTYAEATYAGITLSETSSNRVVLSRIKIDTNSQADVYFSLGGASLNGLLTVTFPAGFSIVSAPTGGSGCLSGFGSATSTIYATKTSCTGDISLTGAVIHTPATPGIYSVTWVNDTPGYASVYITVEDQVGITAAVDPTMTFVVGADTATCNGSFSTTGGTVALGTLTTGAITSSDVNSVKHVCTVIYTNATSGAIVTVKSANASLKSTSTPGDTIPSADGTMAAGTANYGLCAGGRSGKATTTPTSADPIKNSPFNGTCASDTAGGVVGGLTGSVQTVWHVTGPTSAAYQDIILKAAISPTTKAHSDYTDTLTFVATGTF